METFKLLFGLLKPCYVAERIPRTDLTERVEMLF